GHATSSKEPSRASARICADGPFEERAAETSTFGSSTILTVPRRAQDALCSERSARSSEVAISMASASERWLRDQSSSSTSRPTKRRSACSMTSSSDSPERCAVSCTSVMSFSSRLTVVVLLVTIPFWHANGREAWRLLAQPFWPPPAGWVAACIRDRGSTADSELPVGVGRYYDPARGS